jgi:hypothetical protein
MSSSTSSSEVRGGARRVLAIAAGFVVTLSLGVAALLLALGPELTAAGRKDLGHRRGEFLAPERARPELPLALFFGDSTIMKSFGYPRDIARRLRGSLEVQQFAWQGFEGFQHYLILSRMLALEPDVVVLTAQQRTFYRDEPLWYPDLLDLLPLGELPRALALPFHQRGVSLPRLALASLFGSLGETGEQLLEAFVGGRIVARQIPGLRLLVPVRPPESDVRGIVQVKRERFERFAQPIFAGHPAVEILGASVALAERRGAQALVVVSPIPIERLLAERLYDPIRFAAWVDVLRDEVEAAGGELIDLHDALAASDFTDELGHYGERGALRVSSAVQAWLRNNLPRP